MRLSLAVFLFAFLVSGSLSASEKTNLSIRFKPTGDGLIVSYKLARPTTKFRFDHSMEGDGEQQAIPIRKDNWRISEPGFDFDGLTLKRSDGGHFSEFSIRAQPDKRDYDRVYTAVFSMGAKAFGIYSRHFIGNPGSFDSSHCVEFANTCSPDAFDNVGADIVNSGAFVLVGDVVTR